MAKKKGWLKRLLKKDDMNGEGASDSPEAVQEAAPSQEPLEEESSATPQAPEAPPESIETVIEEEPPSVEISSGDLESAQEREDAPEQTPEKKKGLFSRLKKQLSKTKGGLVERVRQVITLHGKVDEEMLEDIEMILIQADVGIETTTKIIDRMRRDSQARKSDSPEDLVEVFKTALQDIVSHDAPSPPEPRKPPKVILVVGVNGVGKTTTIGKLAQRYRSEGKKVMLVAGDTFRAAAVEQLEIWAKRTDSLIVKQEMGSDPSAVTYDALASAEAKTRDVILIDTAGRLQTKSNLMEELKKIHRVAKKVIPDAPHETLLILDATTGQNAISQAEAFSEAVDVTGLIMTKLDGTAKGGILVALRDRFDIPVLKIGIGEGQDDLRDFDPETFIDALFSTE